MTFLLNFPKILRQWQTLKQDIKIAYEAGVCLDTQALSRPGYLTIYFRNANLWVFWYIVCTYLFVYMSILIHICQYYSSYSFRMSYQKHNFIIWKFSVNSKAFLSLTRSSNTSFYVTMCTLVRKMSRQKIS